MTPAQLANQKLAAAYAPGSFLQFYHGDWTKQLDTVQIPGMEDASWDRKAAWLLWLALGNPPDTVSAERSLLKPNLDAKARAAVEGEFDDILG